MKERVICAVSARSPAMRGEAKKWRYWSCGLYEAKPRAHGVGWYWSLVSCGPDRRSYSLMTSDAAALAKQHKCEVLSYGFSIEKTDATDYVWKRLTPKQRERNLERYLRTLTSEERARQAVALSPVKEVVKAAVTLVICGGDATDVLERVGGAA